MNVFTGRFTDCQVVLLQAMREDPPPDARCRDKFLVQSIAITPERDLGTVTAIVSQYAIFGAAGADKAYSGRMLKRLPRELLRSGRFVWSSYQQKELHLLRNITTSMER